METPEGESHLVSIQKFLNENRILNMDIETLVSRGTLAFLQFGNLSAKVSSLEKIVKKLQKQSEENAHPCKVGLAPFSGRLFATFQSNQSRFAGPIVSLAFLSNYLLASSAPSTSFVTGHFYQDIRD